MSDSFGAPQDPNTLTSDEKLFALLSHLSYFFGGIILPIIFWVINRDKSKFATFHSLQALWFHVAIVGIFIITIILMLVFGIGLGILTASPGSKDPPILFIVSMFAFYGLLFIVAIGAMVYSVIM